MAESADLLATLVLLPLEYNRDPSGQRREIETSGWSVPFT